MNLKVVVTSGISALNVRFSQKPSFFKLFNILQEKLPLVEHQWVLYKVKAFFQARVNLL